MLGVFSSEHVCGSEEVPGTEVSGYQPVQLGRPHSGMGPEAPFEFEFEVDGVVTGVCVAPGMEIVEAGSEAAVLTLSKADVSAAVLTMVA
ncbi:hypothetical protein [Streptomyces sp. NPDC001153]